MIFVGDDDGDDSDGDMVVVVMLAWVMILLPLFFFHRLLETIEIHSQTAIFFAWQGFVAQVVKDFIVFHFPN